MGIENVEIKNSDQVNQDLQALGTQMFGDPTQGEPNVEGEAQPSDQVQEQTEEMPNASIRLDKMRKQRDEERTARSDLEKRLAQMEGKLSVLDKSNDVESEADPTDYMDDTQKFLYNENKSLKETIGKLTNVVEGIQTDGSKQRLQEQEDRFFDNNPNLKANKDQFVDDMLDYLKAKPNIKKMLKNGEVNLSEVYGMYNASNPQSTKTARVSDPDKIFSGHSEGVPSGKPQAADVAVQHRKAMQILHDRDSTNKGQAVDFLRQEITNNIISQLD
jgi:hypothetical protein